MSDATCTPDEAFEDPLRLAPDGTVVVRANDYGREGVTGALVSSTARKIVLRREDERAGRVYVHSRASGSRSRQL